MSGFVLLSETFPAARKAHTCIWCGEPIPVAEKHRHERSKFDGEFQDHRWHLECDAAAVEYFRSDGPEFAPHDNERPEKGTP